MYRGSGFSREQKSAAEALFWYQSAWFIQVRALLSVYQTKKSRRATAFSECYLPTAKPQSLHRLP
jgi:hypothetical protein